MATTNIALVTGGTRGIGLGISRALAAAGFNLAVCGRRAEAESASPLDELRARGAEVLYCRADVSDAAQRAGMLVSIAERFGRLSVLVNNAGIAPPVRADILDAGEESFEKLMRVNLQGPYFLTQACARLMIEQKQAAPDQSACIINISSISATVASTNRGDYCISKAGIAMATKLWAARLAEFGIGVYEIQPGIIKTDMTAGVEEKYDRLIKDGLLLTPRWGTPEDIGRVVLMLTGGDIAYATGQVIVLDGGLTLGRL